MRNLILVLAGALAGAALLSTTSVVHTARADGDPEIVLSSITVNTVVEGPASDQPDLPTYVHLGYGVVQPNTSFSSGDVVFYDKLIYPSSEGQTFDANVADDPKAAAFANDLIASPPPDWRTLLFLMQVTRDTEMGYGNGATLVMHIPPGARVGSFKMTVAPFTIEKRVVDPFHGGAPTLGQPAIKPRVTIGPYSVYRMITNGPVATIAAYGPPPPGDATCDAVANSIDALVVEQHAAGLLESLPCAKAADANSDGTIDSVDASLILQFDAGLIAQP